MKILSLSEDFTNKGREFQICGVATEDALIDNATNKSANLVVENVFSGLAWISKTKHGQSLML